MRTKAGAALWVLLALGLAGQPARASSELGISCRFLDDCYCHASDGEVDPAEFLFMEVLFQNIGSEPIVALEGSIDMLLGADVISGDGRFGPLPSAIGPGEVYRRGVLFIATGDCGGRLDVDIVGMRSGGVPSYPSELVACDRVVGDGQCDSCCLPVDVDPIQPILGIKVPGSPENLEFAWQPDPEPSASHYNTWMVVGAANKAFIRDARSGGTFPNVPGCGVQKWTACRHSGGVLASAGTLIYYQVRGVCDEVEAAE